MKTSQIKHFAFNSRLTKLKLDSNLVDHEVDQFFIREDAQKADNVCAVLKQLSTDQKHSIRDAAQLSYDLMSKLKLLLDHHYMLESKQIKFRIVKSAKKVDRVETVSQDDVQFFEIKNNLLKQQPQNRSQVISSKQNKICLQKQLPRPSTLVSNSKIKLKKINQRTNDIMANLSEVKSESNQSIIRDLKDRIKKLSGASEQKYQELSCYKERVQALEQENSKLRGMLLQIETHPKQELKIQFKVSLKCIDEKVQPDPINNKIEVNEKQKSILYFESIISHLQMMIVSQAKQIDNIRTKVIMNTNSRPKNLDTKKNQ